jgi:ribosomal protein S18 acetylase RimI-like enzyme
VSTSRNQAKGERITVDENATSATDSTRRVVLRPARPADGSAVAEIYLAAVRSELGYLRLAHADDEVRDYFRDAVLPRLRVVVAVRDGELVGFGAHADGQLDHLYVRPDVLRQGIGAALLERIKAESPDGLTLFAFQRNWPARAFYRRHGFVVAAFASGADNEEREPDLTLRWTPPAT